MNQLWKIEPAIHSRVWKHTYMERNNNPKQIGDIGVSIVFFVSVTKNKVPGETGRAPGPGRVQEVV